MISEAVFNQFFGVLAFFAVFLFAAVGWIAYTAYDWRRQRNIDCREHVRYLWSRCPDCGVTVKCEETRCLVLPFGSVFGECKCGYIIQESDYEEVEEPTDETPD